jgi:hypothetical protein
MANGRTSYVDRLIVSKTGLIPVFYEDNSLRTGWDGLETTAPRDPYRKRQGLDKPARPRTVLEQYILLLLKKKRFNPTALNVKPGIT